MTTSGTAAAEYIWIGATVPKNPNGTSRFAASAGTDQTAASTRRVAAARKALPQLIGGTVHPPNPGTRRSSRAQLPLVVGPAARGRPITNDHTDCAKTPVSASVLAVYAPRCQEMTT